jgi:hypothetical protein
LKERSALLNEMRFASNLLRGKTPLFVLRTRLFQAGLSKAAQKIGIRMGGRKVSQFIPLLGAVSGGVINKRVTKDIATIAKEVYRERARTAMAQENPE